MGKFHARAFGLQAVSADDTQQERLSGGYFIYQVSLRITSGTHTTAFTESA